MSYWRQAAEYAEGVLAGEIPANELVRLACERFVRDCQREDIYPSQDGERWCKFLELLPHVKGRWASKAQKFKLSPWQVFCTVNLYGWKWTETDRRRFREGYIEVPRKNGKSFWVAGLGIGHLTIDNEFGAEVYCGASTEVQAWEVFLPAKTICERTPELCERYGIQVNAKRVICPGNGSRFAPVIGNPGDGASPSAAIVDEFHEHKTADQVDTFETGMGAREQPMLLYITTAGSDMGGPCYAKRQEVVDILKGTVQDDNIFGIVYGIDEDDRWDDEAALIKANPNYGVSVDPEFLKAKLAQARRSAVKQNAFRTKHLNQWVGAKASWMNILAYQACRKKGLKLEDYAGQQCVVASDLATRNDIASQAIVFRPEPDHYAVFCRHYVPESKVLDGGNTRYKAWHADGWLTATDGNIIDFGQIEEDMGELKTAHEVVSCPYDPFQATQFATRMLDEGFPMLEYGATVRNFSEPMKELEAAILEKRVSFQMDPVLLWMMGNVVAKRDKKDNVFPDKEREENKIDGVVAIIMAIGVIMLKPDLFWSMPDGYEVPVV